MRRSPVYSPCAPAAGCRVKPSIPAMTFSFSCRVYIISRAPCTEAWKRCCHFVHRRIVLHRAGAKGIETMIHTEGLLLQLPIVTVKLHFIELWQIERLLAERNVSGTGRHVRSREQIHPVSFFRAFKNQFHVIHLLSEGKQGCRSPHGCSSPSRTRGSRRLQQARLGCRVRRASARPPPDRSGS